MVFVLIVILAIFLRFYHLDERVFHHDEAAVGYFTYRLFKDGIYSYDPSFHGPFMYYATSEIFKLCGDNEYAARLLPALLGSTMLLLLIPLRRYIGEKGMVYSAFLIAFSPSFLYYSRFFREDIFISFFSLAMFISMVKYAENRNKLYLFFGAVSLAFLTALKENAYITMALIILFLFLVFIREQGYKHIQYRKLVMFLSEVLFFMLVFLIVFSLFYTGKILDIHGMKLAIEKAIFHWYEMHRIQRISGPMYFYIPIMMLYELPIMIFGIAGIIYYKKNNFIMTFIGYWALSNLIVYSYLQEKVPWLILNPLLPLAILAGSYLGITRMDSKLKVIVIIMITYFVYSSVFLNYYNYTNPAEPLIQAAQPPQRFSELLNKIHEISSQYQNYSTQIQVADKGIETQFLWHLRHYNNIKWRVSIDSEFYAPLIVVHDTDGESEADIVQRRLSYGYERLDSAKMSWYFFKPSDITLEYLLYRKINRPPGEYRVVLFYKPKTIPEQPSQTLKKEERVSQVLT